MSKSKQTRKPAAQTQSELSEAALARVAGGSFSWGMQSASMVGNGMPKPGELLPAVQKIVN